MIAPGPGRLPWHEERISAPCTVNRPALPLHTREAVPVIRDTGSAVPAVDAIVCSLSFAHQI